MIAATGAAPSARPRSQPEGEDSDAVREQVMAVVRAHFRPEFLNRVDENPAPG